MDASEGSNGCQHQCSRNWNLPEVKIEQDDDLYVKQETVDDHNETCQIKQESSFHLVVRKRKMKMRTLCALTAV